MSIKKIGKRLNKIQSFVDIFSEDDNLSLVEKDLLLESVRKLYVQIAELKTSEVEKKSAPISIVEPVTVPKAPAAKPVAVEPEVAVAVKEPVVVEEKVAPKTNHKKYDELFAFENINDLSEKLSMAKISDLNKVIGINERIFNINELFGGDNESYKATVNDLNNAASFEDAKDILIKNAIERYDWSNEDRTKKAQHFIKIVRRLYV